MMEDSESTFTGIEVRSPTPSTMLIIWPEAESPLQEEVRLALVSQWPESTLVEDLDSHESILWGGVYRLGSSGGDMDFVLWAEDRGDLGDEFLESQLTNPAELDLARSSQWVVGVECMLPPGDPLQGLHRQLQVIDRVAVPGLCAVYDDNGITVRSGRAVQDMARSPVPPRSTALYGVHAVGDEQGNWIHTHGLSRAGLPDLDLVGVPNELVGVGIDLIQAVTDWMLYAKEAPPNDGMVVELGHALTVRVVPVTQHMESLPLHGPGSREDRDGDLHDHLEGRLLILDATQDSAPLRSLHDMGEQATLFKTRNETNRQRQLAQGRFSLFGQLFAMHRGDSWSFLVKLTYPQCEVPTVNEHLWFTVRGLKPGAIEARLDSEPLDVPDLHPGDVGWHDLERLTDFLVCTPDGTYDPELVPALLDDED